MNKFAPFLWFDDNAEEAAQFYLSVLPHAQAPRPRRALPK
jgi:predicted 3-demethylubiquinone-9 3-methyltransferase (glyoxalase superfamily)